MAWRRGGGGGWEPGEEVSEVFWCLSHLILAMNFHVADRKTESQTARNPPLTPGARWR